MSLRGHPDRRPRAPTRRGAAGQRSARAVPADPDRSSPGSAILLAGFTQPLGLLIVSTCAASVVTLLYSILLVRLNTRDLPAEIRMRGWRLGGMLVAIGFFAIDMVVTQLQRL